MHITLRAIRKIFFFDIRYLYEINPENFNCFISNRCKIEKVNRNNVRDILYFQDKKYIDIFLRFLEENDEGYLAYMNNKCIHRQWIQQNKKVQFSPTYKYNLKSDELYCHYVETAADARGQGVSKAVLSKIILKYPNKKVLLTIQKGNFSSMSFCKGIGGQKVGIIYSIILFGINFSFKKNVFKLNI